MRCRPNLTHTTLRSKSAFTYIEALVATAVVALALGAAMEANSIVFNTSRKAHDVNTATLYVQERVEQLRNVAWPDMMSSSYFTGTYFGSVPSSASGLGGSSNITESISIEAFPPTTGPTPMVIQSTLGGTPQVLQPGSGLVGQMMARVRVHIQWTGQGGKLAQHEVDTVISSSSGITAASLPGMGAFAGGANGSSSSTSSSSSSDSSSSSSSSSTTTTTDTTGNSGNGKGQGNVGGKNGKG